VLKRGKINLARLSRLSRIAPNIRRILSSEIESQIFKIQPHVSFLPDLCARTSLNTDPYYQNINRRLVKSPKVFFYDVGLLCALLHISSVEELTNHFAIGGIFENFIISEFKKEIDMRGLSAELFFYRDSNGREVDLLIDRGGSLIPVEIKSSATYNHSFFDILTYWRKHIDPKQSGYVVYGGATTQGVQSDHLVSWNDLGVIVDRIH